MKKLLVILSLLAASSMAFAQGGKLPYVGDAYTGPNVAVASEDAKLGMHDILATGVGTNSVALDRNGCVSCHAPHNQKNLGQSTMFAYMWTIGTPANTYKSNSPDAYGTEDITLDETSFHTVACLSCHDGQTATDVYTNYQGAFTTNDGNHAYARKGFQGDLSHDHPVHASYTPHGTTIPSFARFYGGTKNGDGTVATYGYVECGTCHDPHKGDGNTYMFLRSPKGVAATQRFARIDLCRDCHGK